MQRTSIPSSSLLFLLFLFLFLAATLAQETVMFPPIKEEQEPGQVVGDIVRGASLRSHYSKEELALLRFEFVKNDGIAQYFHLIEKTGVLRTRLRIDRDTLCKSDGICCPSYYRSSGGSVGDMGGGGGSDTGALPIGPVCRVNLAVRVLPQEYLRLIRVSVGLEDINDNAPSFDTAKRSFQVSETSPPNTEISLPMARDPDAGYNGISEYKLNGGNGVFQLRVRGNVMEGFTKLSLMTKKVLDREKKSWYAVNITALDYGKPVRKSGVLQVNITVTDDNDCVPKFTNQTYIARVTEDHSLRHPIIRVEATDRDEGENGRVSYFIDPSAPSAILNTFSVNNANGDIYLQKTLDYETRKGYTVPVLAVDNGLSKKLSVHTVIHVNVIDVNDQSPVITVTMGSDYGRVEVPENYKPNVAIATISVSDKDAGENGEVDCDLEEGKNSFQLTATLKRSDSQGEAFYTLKSLVRFDRETQAKYRVVIACSDRGRPPLRTRKAFDVYVTDMNDNSPKFNRKVYNFLVRENNEPRKEIGQLHAMDADAHKNGRVQYVLDPADDPNVSLDPDSGRLYAKQSFDRERLQSFTVRVIAHDMAAKTRFSATATVTVIIEDMNDNQPVFKLKNQRIEVAEDIHVPTTVTTLEAHDPDEGRNGRVRFASRTGTQWFHLTQDGRLSVAAKLDREKRKEHVLVVVAFDEGDHPLTSTATITITVTDVNDHSPRFIIPSAENRQVNITADYHPDSLVTRFVAKDNDEGNNGLVKYRFKQKGNSNFFGSDPFFLNEDTGDLKVVGTLDPKQSTYKLLVEAYDQGTPPRTSLTMMTIRVLDGTRQKGIRHPRKGNYGGVVPNAVVMIVACMIIVVLIVLLFLLICIVYRRNKRHLGGDRSPTPTGLRDPPAYDAIAVTGHGMPPSNQLLLNSKLNSCGGVDSMSAADSAVKKELEDDSASEVDHLLYENDDRNCNSECHKGRPLELSYPAASPRPQCLPAGHWRSLYNEDSPLRKPDLKSADGGSPLRKGSLTLARQHVHQPGSEPYYHTLGQPGYTTPQHPSNSPPSPYANLKRDRSNTYCEDFTLANQKALNMPTLQTPRANRALRYPYDDVTSV